MVPYVAAPTIALGVAQVASAYVAIPECRRWSEAALAVLFNDDDAAVRGEAASCFRHLKDEVLDTYGVLLAAFCDSNAFRGRRLFLDPSQAGKVTGSAARDDVPGLREIPRPLRRRREGHPNPRCRGYVHCREARFPYVPAAPERRMDFAAR